MPVNIRSSITGSKLPSPYDLLQTLKDLADGINAAEAKQVTFTQQITNLGDQVSTVINAPTTPPAPIGPFPSVIVDVALEGDGTAGSPINVRVDGTTVIVNGSNQLEALVPTDVLTGTLTPTRIPYASAAHVLSDSAAFTFDTTTTRLRHSIGGFPTIAGVGTVNLFCAGDFGLAGSGGHIMVDGYANAANLSFRRSDGTATVPTEPGNGAVVCNLRALAWDGTGMQLGGFFRYATDQTWVGGANRGMDFQVYLTDTGTTAAPTIKLALKSDGRMLLGLSGTPQSTLQVNGNIRTGFGLATSFQTTINILGGISAVDVTITVASAANFPIAGVVKILGELITYTGKTATTLTGCTRGRFLTTATAAANGTVVLLMPFVSAESDTSGVSFIVGPGQLYIGSQGNLFDIGSGSTVAVVKVGNQFSVSGTAGVAWQDAAVTGMAFFLWDGTNAVFGTRTNAPIQFRTNNTGRAYITSNQNLTLNGATNGDPGTGTMCLILGDGTAPSSLASNTCGLYGNDVSGTVNVFAINEAGVVNQLTAPDSTYTPTRSAEVNMDANVTPTVAQYMRNGNFVTVSGQFSANPTTAGLATSFELSLPIASNIGAVADCSGVAAAGGIASMSGAISGSVANNTAVFSWIATDVTAQTWSYIYSYRVI